MIEMDWDDLKYFAALCECRSLSKVSKMMNVEHSTVVRRLDRLEKTLNVRLFDRMARGWQLTQAAEQLCQLTLPFEDSIKKIARFSLVAGDIAGEVRLSGPPALLTEIVVPALRSFSQKWPQISLSIISETRPVNLSAGEADIALRMISPNQGELVTKKLCDITYKLYGTAKWQNVPQQERSYIGFLQGSRSYVSQRMDGHIGNRETILRSNDMRVILTAIETGLGIGLLPTFLGEKIRSLTVVEELEEPARCPVSLVMQQDVRNSARVRMVADFLSEALSKQDKLPHLNDLSMRR